MNLIEKLKKEIEHQSRNGRDDMYIKVSDLKELIEATEKIVYGEKESMCQWILLTI